MQDYIRDGAEIYRRSFAIIRAEADLSGFSAEEAENWAKAGKKVILTRIETSPEDIHGMNAAEGILTAKGGVSSHAALVARQMGKVCVCGAAGAQHATATRHGHELATGDDQLEGRFVALLVGRVTDPRGRRLAAIRAQPTRPARPSGP